MRSATRRIDNKKKIYNPNTNPATTSTSKENPRGRESAEAYGAVVVGGAAVIGLIVYPLLHH